MKLWQTHGGADSSYPVVPARNFPILAYLAINVIEVCDAFWTMRAGKRAKERRAAHSTPLASIMGETHSSAMPLGVNAQEQNKSCANNS
jgi:hypothetical protein